MNEVRLNELKSDSNADLHQWEEGVCQNPMQSLLSEMKRLDGVCGMACRSVLHCYLKRYFSIMTCKIEASPHHSSVYACIGGTLNQVVQQKQQQKTLHAHVTQRINKPFAKHSFTIAFAIE
ncbi:hypothetical protein CEXT_469371 [Caerostris extrusa]|uniref:Uncharacterized protein n=1 Tax=Caerostris extrusa TaxID=172846 RepID=A0AAV4WT94_CAEEX|nr:hypothetical protein CEXT_469371 [Caerostris extrusa]